MAEAFRPDVSSALLVWARTSAHLKLEEIAGACQVSEAEVEQWESGAAKPTLDQLRHIASRTKRSLAVFFLATAPTEAEVPQQFRTLGSKAVAALSPNTVVAIRSAQESQERAVELLSELDPSFTVQLPVLSMDSDVGVAGTRLREALDISLAQQHDWKNESEAYKQWRGAVEKLGVITLQASFPLDDGRAFCLFNRQAPVIAINSWDCMSGRIFSLIHELAHLCLGLSTLSPLRPLSSRASQHDREMESFCNRLAAEVLLPLSSDTVKLALRRCFTSGQIDQGQVKQVANAYKVSRAVVVRSLATLGTISNKDASAFERTTTNPVRRKGGGPAMPQPQLCVTRKGVRFPSMVIDAYDQDRITMADASWMLGLKVKWFEGLREQLEV